MPVSLFYIRFLYCIEWGVLYGANRVGLNKKSLHYTDWSPPSNFWKQYLFLFERQILQRQERIRSSLCRATLQMVEMIKTELIWSQLLLGTPGKVPRTWATVYCFPRSQAGNGAAMTWTNTHMGCKNWKQRINILCYCVSIKNIVFYYKHSFMRIPIACGVFV